MANVTPLQGAATPKVKMDDLVSWEESPLFVGNKHVRYNPDSLVGRKGLDVYAVMRTDEQVKAVTVFKRDAITSRGWSFKYSKTSSLSEDEQKRRIHVFSSVVQRMRGSFEDCLNSISTGREFGFSLTEKVYSQIDIDGTSYIGLSDLFTRDPATFEFYTDEYGMLVRFAQRVNGRTQDLDISRFIHYVHSPEFDRYYGRSDLREAYRSWFAKDSLVKMWLVYLERLGGGFAVAKRTAESTMTNGSPEYASLRNMLTNIKSAAGIILPKGIELEVIMPAATDQYEQAIVFHDLAIAKALLVPNLLGISHTGQTGAYSQSQTQFEAFLWTLNADAKRLEACLNEQLFRDIGDQNFGDGEYPEFCFKPASMEHTKWVLSTWASLIQANAVKPTEKDEAYIRSLLEMPERDSEDDDEESAVLIPNGDTEEDPTEDLPEGATDVTVGSMPAGQVSSVLAITEAVGTGALPHESAKAILAASFPAMDPATIAAIIDPIEVKEPPAPALPESPPSGPPEASPSPAVERKPADSTMSRVVAHTHDGKPRTVSVAAFNRAVQRVNFSVIDSRMSKLSESTADALAMRMARAIEYAVGDTKEFMEEPTRIQDAKLSGDDVGKLKQLCNQALTAAFRVGSEMGQNEMARAGAERTQAKSFAALRDKAADYLEANGFRMAGNLSDGARAILQQELQTGIRQGRSPQETKAAIWERMVVKGFTSISAVNEVEMDEDVISEATDLVTAAIDTWTEATRPGYLDTLVRTNTFEAMNEARYNEFTDPALADFVVGLEYSAVLDSSTTPICQALDGMKLNSDNEAWDTLRPPNHYNCRSLLIPITTIDGWDGVESEIPDVEPAVGFAYNPDQERDERGRWTSGGGSGSELAPRYEPSPGLSSSDRAVETRFGQQLNNFETSLKQYAALPETAGGRILNTDEVRELSPDYRADRSLAGAVHEPASQFTKDMYAYQLAQAPGEGQKAQVLFSAGGAGAGKTTGLEKLGSDVETAQIIYDTNMAGFKGSVSKIDQALESNKVVTIAYTYRDPIDSFTNGAIPRTQSRDSQPGGGRPVPIEEFVKTHVGASETMFQLLDHYKGDSRVRFEAIDNSRGRGNAEKVPFESLPRLRQSDYSRILSEAQNVLEAARSSGRISERVYWGFKGRGKGGH